jgi:branched-subunit amino acid transport protein
MNGWTLFAVLGMGIVTLALRASFLFLPPDTRLPELFERGLRYIAAAVLPALIIPDVIFSGPAAQGVLDPLRMVAAVAAGLIAWWTRSVLATLAVGLGTLLLLKWWMAA